MDLPAVAERMGWTVRSARAIHGRSQVNRRRGTPKPGDLPPPDEYVAGHPAWDEATIEAWIPTRPGRGKGGGRPKAR